MLKEDVYSGNDNANSASKLQYLAVSHHLEACPKTALGVYSLESSESCSNPQLDLQYHRSRVKQPRHCVTSIIDTVYRVRTPKQAEGEFKVDMPPITSSGQG